MSINYGNRGRGRKKGVPNRVTKSVREAFEATFVALQQDDQASLLAWSKANPSAFYQLAARLIPAQMQVGLTSGTLTERLIAARQLTKKV